MTEDQFNQLHASMIQCTDALLRAIALAAESDITLNLERKWDCIDRIRQLAKEIPAP